MEKDDSVYLGHMLDCAFKAVGKVHGRTRADFDADENLRLALTHLVQVIGEAARRVSEATRAAHPQIPWHAIVGMRHKVVHDYLEVSEDILWEVVTRSLPELIRLLSPIVPPEGV